MWTLAHAHGTLLAVVHIVFGLEPGGVPGAERAASADHVPVPVAASVLLPGGFFLGGVAFYSGDPGLGVLLVPAGAVLLLLALFYMARETGSLGDSREKPPPGAPRRNR